MGHSHGVQGKYFSGEVYLLEFKSPAHRVLIFKAEARYDRSESYTGFLSGGFLRSLRGSDLAEDGWVRDLGVGC